MPPFTAASPDARDRASAVPRGGPSTGRTDLDDPGLHEAVEHLGGALAHAGLARLPARVFAALLATPDGRLTSAELVHPARGQPGRRLGSGALPLAAADDPPGT